MGFADPYLSDSSSSSGSIIKFPVQIQPSGASGSRLSDSSSNISLQPSGTFITLSSPGGSSLSGGELDIELVDGAAAVVTAGTDGAKASGHPRGVDAHIKQAHRRTHRKSRMGCGMCKTRKVKCDEAKPRCGNCMDRSEKCIYPDMSVFRAHKPVVFTGGNCPGDPSTPPEVYDTGEFDEAIPRPGPTYTSNRLIKAGLSPHFALVPGRAGRPTNEARLLHHWITVTCSGIRFPKRSSTLELMREVVPQLATAHPFLQDALLACAAVHLSDRTSSEPQTLINSASERYFNRGLRGFQQVLAEPAKTLASVEAVFATSMLIAVWNGMNAFHHSAKGDFYDDFVRYFHMAQGPKTIGANYWQSLDGTRTRLLIEQREGATVLDSELSEFLKQETLMPIASRVMDNLEEEVTDPVTRDAYRTTMGLIEWVHAALLGPPHEAKELATRVNTFPTILSGAFVRLLTERDERAIAIAAHYLATACKVDSYSWFLAGGKLKRYVRVLCGMVRRKEWVVWPLITIGDSWTSALLQVDGKLDESICTLAAQVLSAPTEA